MQFFQPKRITLSLLSPSVFLPNIWTKQYFRSLPYQESRTTKRRVATDSVEKNDGTDTDTDTSPVNGTIFTPPVDKRASFRRRREMMAQQLLVEYDRTAFGELLLQQKKFPIKTRNGDTTVLDSPLPKVTIKWSNRLRTTAGRAHLMLRTVPPIQGGKKLSPKGLQDPIEPHQRPPQGDHRIAIVELSTKVVDDEVRLQTTLLHELCHVAAWIVDGNVKPPHGPCFQKWVAIVTNAIQPTIPIPTKHNFEIHYKYSWECTNTSCSDTLIKRHSQIGRAHV